MFGIVYSEYKINKKKPYFKAIFNVLVQLNLRSFSIFTPALAKDLDPDHGSEKKGLLIHGLL